MDGRKILARAFELAASPRVYPVFERVADAHVPRALRSPIYRSLAWLGDIDLDEMQGRPEDYTSLSAFFVRRLLPGARPIDPDPAAVVSPADGKLQGVGTFGPGDDPVVQVKGASLALGRALGDRREAIAGGGHYFVVYLSPRNYHRVHAPIDGRVRSWQSVPGTRFPVNRLGFRACPEVLSSNERAVIELQAEGGARFFLVLVAAYGVARTGLAFADPGEVRRRSGGPAVDLDPAMPFARGAEIGAFHLGSTAICIWPAARDPVVWLRCAGPIRMGQAVARRTVDGEM
jgi:phosphatidylserine decarboxylase